MRTVRGFEEQGVDFDWTYPDDRDPFHVVCEALRLIFGKWSGHGCFAVRRFCPDWKVRCSALDVFKDRGRAEYPVFNLD